MTFLPRAPLPIVATMSTETDHAPSYQTPKYDLLFLNLPQRPLIFIPLSIVFSPSILTLSMITRKKNKTAHPGIPDMTPLQLASAGISHPRTARRSSKKLTKDQQIAALRDKLRAAEELILNARYFILYPSNLIHAHVCPFSRARWTTAVHRHRLMQVATPSLRPISRKRRLSLQVQNARP